MDNETLRKVPHDKRWGQMPSHYHPDDAKIISARLGMLEPVLRSEVCAAYAKAYLEAWEAESVPHKKHNKARFAANTRLRIFIGKRFAVFNR
jgi:hypothetical protein